MLGSQGGAEQEQQSQARECSSPATRTRKDLVSIVPCCEQSFKPFACILLQLPTLPCSLVWKGRVEEGRLSLSCLEAKATVLDFGNVSLVAGSHPLSGAKVWPELANGLNPNPKPPTDSARKSGTFSHPISKVLITVPEIGCCLVRSC